MSNFPSKKQLNTRHRHRLCQRREEKTKIPEVVLVFAHRLKDPINALKGYFDILLSKEAGEINPRQEEYLKDALEILERINRTVNEFLEAAKAEAGIFEINPKPIALEEIIAQIIKDFFYWARALNCEITFRKPTDLPRVWADPARIREVIENFISNSVKYTKGKGLVEISLEKKKDEVIFKCEDNGVGIKKEDFDKIFKKFFRSKEAMSLNPQGSGLGLFLNKIIIEMHQGRIWFQPKKRGIIFYFSLPIAKK